MQIHTGYGRLVLLIGAYAIKIPNPHYGERAIVMGMAANIHEAELFQQARLETETPRLAQVYFRLPLGLALITRRYDILKRSLTGEEIKTLPVANPDPKIGNYGLDNQGRIIVLDYGHSGCWYTGERS